MPTPLVPPAPDAPGTPRCIVEYTYTTAAEIVLKGDKGTVPAGSTLLVAWNDCPATAQGVRWIGAPGGDRNLRLSGKSIGKAIAGSFPSPDQLETWVFDSVCETPTGDTVEPDGRGPDGCPSWLLLLGMV